MHENGGPKYRARLLKLKKKLIRYLQCTCIFKSHNLFEKKKQSSIALLFCLADIFLLFWEYVDHESSLRRGG